MNITINTMIHSPQYIRNGLGAFDGTLGEALGYDSDNMYDRLVSAGFEDFADLAQLSDSEALQVLCDVFDDPNLYID